MACPHRTNVGGGGKLTPLPTWPVERLVQKTQANPEPLFPDPKPFHESGVTLRARAVEIAQQPRATPDHHQQPATRRVVLAVGAQMFSQVIDPLRQQCPVGHVASTGKRFDYGVIGSIEDGILFDISLATRPGKVGVVFHRQGLPNF